MTTGTQQPAPPSLTTVLNQLGELIEQGQARNAGFGRMEARVERLETDVAELRTGLEATKAQLTRMELADERRDNRIDARFDELVKLIRRDELGDI